MPYKQQLEQNMNSLRLISKAVVAQLLNTSIRTVDRRIARGLFPAPMKIGHLSKWPLSIVETWIADQIRKNYTRPTGV